MDREEEERDWGSGGEVREREVERDVERERGEREQATGVKR